MKVLKSKRNGNTVNLEIEISHEEIEAKMDGAFKKVSKKASLPGFRKGKIPRKIFEREYGKQGIIQEAVYDALNDNYKNAIKELELKVVDYPKNVDVDEYKENKAVKYRCDVDVEPEVKIKKYKGLSIKFEEKKPDDKELQKELDVLTDMYATYESVDKESKKDDVIRFNSSAKIEDAKFELWSRDNLATRLGLSNYGESVDTELTGLKKGDKKQFSATYADDFKVKEVAGKVVDFDIEVLEVREKIKAKLDDELAKKIDKDCETVDALKGKLQKELETRLESQNEQEKENLIFEALIEENPVEIPAAMVEQELNFALYQFEYNIQQQGMKLDQYLNVTNKTIDDLKNDLKPTSEKQVKLRKLVEKIIEKEKLEVSDDDIQKEIETWKHESIKTIDDLNKSKSHDLQTLKNNMLDKKVRSLLVSSAKIK